MAEPQDIPQPNQEQEVILQRTPFTKAFLSQPPDINGDWLDKLEPQGELLEREIAQKLGNDWWITTLGPMTLMTEEQDIFDTSLVAKMKHVDPKELLFPIVKSLFLIGYEVGNKKEAFSFSVPVSGKLSQHGLFHYPVPENQVKSYPEKVFNTVWGIIQSGAFIRLYTDKESKTPGGKGDSIKDFIEGLEGIDKLPPEPPLT